jgi:hypothetical protein
MDTDQPLPPYYFPRPLHHPRLAPNVEMALAHLERAARILRAPYPACLEEALWRLQTAAGLISAEAGGDNNPEV